MIQDLTKDNLFKSGCNEQEANELFNTTGNYNLQCNNGKFYVSKLENKFYTGIDFYRITCLKAGDLQFPVNCPDLIPEYFDLALIEFLQIQKKSLGILFNEINQTEKFTANEINRSKANIENANESFLKRTQHFFESKRLLINVYESYIYFLENKQNPPQQNLLSKPDEVKIELHNQIFKDNAFEVFEKYHSTKSLAENSKTDLNLLFQLFQNDNLFVETVELKHFIKWLNFNYHYSLIELKKVNIKTKPNIQRTNDYNEIKKTTLRQP